jgi:UDP-N-acetyl-D-mannosaminuronic acid transferase (WecB/TagA/CpsF family)
MDNELELLQSVLRTLISAEIFEAAESREDLLKTIGKVKTSLLHLSLGLEKKNETTARFIDEFNEGVSYGFALAQEGA